MWRPIPCLRVLVLGFVLVGCGPRANVDPVLIQPDVGTELPILVGTTRALEAPGRYSKTERGQLSYARFVVSVPPSHQGGSIEVAGRNPDPATDFVTRRSSQLGASDAFRSALRQEFRDNPGADREVVVFIHGFNNTVGDGVYRLAQMDHDLKLDGIPVHYSWPSAANPLGYVRDRDSALFARDGLARMLDDIAAAGARSVILIAHSMGSFLTMETLAWMAQNGRHPGFGRIGGVVLLSPDIDVELFKAQAAAVGELPQPFFIFTSSRDRALALSARLTGERDRLGSLSSIDEVADLEVAVIDVSNVSDAASSHMAALSSPTMIALLGSANAVDAAFAGDATSRLGLIPGVVVSVRDATSLVVAPVDALATALE